MKNLRSVCLAGLSWRIIISIALSPQDIKVHVANGISWNTVNFFKTFVEFFITGAAKPANKKFYLQFFLYLKDVF